MQKSATLNVRVDPEVKKSAESVLEQLGLSMSTAVDMFLRQVSLTGGIPFSVTLPKAPPAVDARHMDDVQLSAILARGIQEAESDKSAGAEATLSNMHQELFGA